jgi:FtsZ-binding cell division protein ZapB
MDTNQQPKAAYLAQELKAGKWSPNILQNEVALRQCAADELLRLHAENETLRTGYDAARLEIESLQTRLIHANEQHRLWFDRSQELEAKLDAVGAGGVEPLRKRECLHQIAEPAPVVAQTEALVRYCPGCGSVGTVEGKYRDCCPDGNEARMIPQALAKKCHDTFKIAVDGLLAQPQEAAPVAQAVPAEARQLHGDARLAHDQCRAVVSLANSVAEVYAARAAIVEHDNSLASQIGQASAAAMEWLGDELNASDAATEEDEWLDPIFDAAQERWPQYAQAALAAVAVPTKVIEALEMLENGALNVAIAKNRGDGYDEGYANAMAKLARETLDALAAAPAGAPVVLSAPVAAQTMALLERDRQPLTDAQKREMATNWFSEDWAVSKALGLLADYETAQGITAAQKGDAHGQPT